MKNLGKKKLLTISLGIVGLLALIIVILLIFHAITGGRKLTYKEIENKVLVAAKKYYGDNKNLLPQNESEQVSTTDADLTKAGYLKSMSELTKKMDGVTCNANVVVSNYNSNYRYTVLLDCGDNYSSKTLVSHIKNKEKRVYSGDGLYELNGELVYRGEFPNNFVKISKNMFRIVKIENNKLVLIYDDRIENVVWDDRYNIERDYQEGINDYTVSRIKDTLNELYEDNTLFSAQDKTLLTKHSAYIGKRNYYDSYNDGSIEKSRTLDNQYISLLPLYDYINASIDVNCITADSSSCSNYNYLNIVGFNWWTSTADAETTHKVYRISGDGQIGLLKANSNGYLRPVIHLASDAIYAGGTGTEEDPYIIK